MLAYVRYLLINYLYQDLDSVPSHEFYQLLTSEHLETFQAAFSSLDGTLNDIENDGDRTHEPQRAPAQRELPSAETEAASVNVPSSGPEESIIEARSSTPTTGAGENPGRTTTRTTITPTAGPTPPRQPTLPRRRAQCDSPTRSDEGYGSYSGESYTDRAPDHDNGDDTNEEIAALGIIEEGDEVPDYGVALEPAAFNSISPQKPVPSPQAQHTTRRPSSAGSSGHGGKLSPGASPTRTRLAELTGPTPKQRRTTAAATTKSQTGAVGGGLSENARNLLSIGYTLSLMGEKMDRTRSIEGSVKSVILKAGQAIEKSQAGSVYGKSRYGESKYGGSKYGGSKYGGGGSRYGGSKFGGSKRSVARSVVLEENLPDWGF